MLAPTPISLAASTAGAAAKGIPLWKHYAEVAETPIPDTMSVPCFNIINGGEHAGNKLAFQEFFVIPTGAATFSESMEIVCETFHALKGAIKAKFGGDATFSLSSLLLFLPLLLLPVQLCRGRSVPGVPSRYSARSANLRLNTQ